MAVEFDAPYLPTDVDEMREALDRSRRLSHAVESLVVDLIGPSPVGEGCGSSKDIVKSEALIHVLADSARRTNSEITLALADIARLRTALGLNHDV